MARQRRKTNLDFVLEALAKLPWQLCLTLSAVSYFAFHQLSQIHPPATHDLSQLGSNIQFTIFKTAGQLLQIVAPLVLLIGALISWAGKRQRARLLAGAERRTASRPLQELSWHEFEKLVAGHFERLGYSVNLTPDGADGGIDVIARKGRETFLIQCKQWRATQIGVSVVRELFGLMAARGATGAFVVSIGPFSPDAKAFAEGRNIELVDAHVLLTSTTKTLPSRTALVADAQPRCVPLITDVTSPVCPKCGARMVKRIAKQGVKKGHAFYGCSAFPKCHGIRPAD